VRVATVSVPGLERQQQRGIFMKHYLNAILVGLAALSLSPLANARVALNIGIGVPGYYGPPPVVYQPQPVYGPPPVVYSDDRWGDRGRHYDRGGHGDHRDNRHDNHR